MSRANNVLQIVINGTNNTGPAFRSVAAGAAAMGTAVAASLTAAAFSAAKLEKGVAEIGTLLDNETVGSMRAMREELQEMSVTYAQSIDKMTKARYDIVSAGFTGISDSALVLETSAKLASPTSRSLRT